ncbi:MAG: hypothetical protein IJY06_09485 [Oscillospiraceae bacterium]|nr:hypothetical protein [Oscillospiraceae bacterium]
MGKIANALAGVTGTAILTVNSFFGGTSGEAAQTDNAADIADTNNMNHSVASVQMQDEGVGPSEWVSGVSEGIETAVEDHATQSETQETQESSQGAGTAAMTTGAAPPDHGNDEDMSDFGIDANDAGAEETDVSDINDSMGDFGTDAGAEDSAADDGNCDSGDCASSDDDGMSM